MSVRSVIALCLCAVIGLASSAFAQERTPLFPRKSDKTATAEVKSETKNKKVVRKAGEKQKATAQRVTAKSSQKIEAPAPLPPEEVVKYGNNSELRSETQRPRSGFLAVIFGEGQELLPQRLTVAVPAGVADGDRFSFTLWLPRGPRTRVNVRVAVTA